jgi:NADH-quinone oxidoreductase subunit L
MLPVFEQAEGMLLIITIVGLTTALLTGFMAFAQTDIKKVLAYSTVGQLGFMFVALGAGEPNVAMFHLMTHAFFKALLFLGSGSVILGTHHNQEMNKLGGLWKKMPITGTTFFIGSLALAGIPPLAGFWSKDEILVAVNHSWGAWALIILGFSAICTAFYTTRLFIRTFMGEPQDRDVYDHVKESPLVMTIPLIFLAFLAIVSGFVVFHGVGKALGFPGGITEFIFLSSEGPHRYHIDWGFAAGSVGLGLTGIWLGAWMYWRGSTERSTRLANFQPAVYDMIKNKFYFDEMFQYYIDRGVLGFSYIVSWFDRYVVNDTGVDGSAQATGYAGFILKYLQTGRLPNYAMGIALGVVGLALAGLVVRG